MSKKRYWHTLTLHERYAMLETLVVLRYLAVDNAGALYLTPSGEEHLDRTLKGQTLNAPTPPFDQPTSEDQSS